jgi:hypothetical protein
MKKQYLKPEIKTIDTDLSGVLCVSTPIDEDATSYALAPYCEWEDEE